MKAVVKTKKGEGNIEFMDWPEPHPGPGQVKIRVRGAGVCGSDVHVLHEHISIPMNLPIIIGHELCGEIAEVGAGVRNYQAGDRVTSETTYYKCGRCPFCQIGWYNMCPERLIIGFRAHGAYAEYCVMPEIALHRLPESVDFISGALCEPLAVCTHATYELTGIYPGDWVYVSGPGPIGLLCMQLAKAAGANVAIGGVAVDEGRLKIAQSLGANRTVRVDQEDPVTVLKDLTGGAGADIVIECAGVPAATAKGLDVVRKRGKFTQIGLFGRPIEIDFEKICFKEILVTGSFGSKWTTWEKAIQILAEGKVQTRPLVSSTRPLDQWKEAILGMETKEEMKVVLVP